MGRRAKYITAAQQSTAARTHKQTYLATTSGQVVRLTSRRATYWREHGWRGPSKPLELQHTLQDMLSLPTDLVMQAQFPLPESASLFQEAIRGSDGLDESDLYIWKTRPPYTTDGNSTSTAWELYFTERLVEVMHGVMLREQREADVARRDRFMQLDRKMALGSLADEVTKMVEEWAWMTDFMKNYSAGCREMTMARLYLQWQARTAHHVYYLLFL